MAKQNKTDAQQSEPAVPAETKSVEGSVLVALSLPIVQSKHRHGFRLDVTISHDDAQVLHGVRAAMELQGERLRKSGRLVNSNADAARRIIELLADEYRRIMLAR